ncbi:hypothetical protein CsSME_00020122 [Camellia sinensis var. sinensis]
MASSQLLIHNFLITIAFGILLLFPISIVSADDPKSPACNKLQRLVKIKMWVNGAEGEELGGSTAKFGADLPTDAKDGLRLPAVFANPLNCCSSYSSKLSGSIALSPRGDCDFMTKAEVAQSGGAAELLVIHDKEDLLEMSCREKNIVNIKIPVVMIAKSGGEAINKSMTGGRKVEIMLYSPNRPIVDFSVVFLWLMAVGTVISASLWSEFTSTEQNDDRYELSPKESASADAEEEVLDISAKSAVVFVISASTFLVLLYLFMSSWFVWLLVAVFCLGGIEVLTFLLIIFLVCCRIRIVIVH